MSIFDSLKSSLPLKLPPNGFKHAEFNFEAYFRQHDNPYTDDYTYMFRLETMVKLCAELNESLFTQNPITDPTILLLAKLPDSRARELLRELEQDAPRVPDANKYLFKAMCNEYAGHFWGHYPTLAQDISEPLIDPKYRRGTHTVKYGGGFAYSGQLQGGVRNGFGVFECPDGCRYAGLWIDNKFHGFAMCYNAEGKLTYSGQFADGRRHGYGFSPARHPGGQEECCIWEQGIARSNLTKEEMQAAMTGNHQQHQECIKRLAPSIAATGAILARNALQEPGFGELALARDAARMGARDVQRAEAEEDAATRDFMTKLQRAKQMHVAQRNVEAYEKAERLKNVHDSLCMALSNLEKLDSRERAALQSDDISIAKKCRAKIESIRSEIQATKDEWNYR